MAIPNVFVSSTFVDLKHLREHIEKFIKTMGYKPIMFEFGGIGFDFEQPLDESCFDEVKSSDIFVSIIGGRYGTPTSDNILSKSKKYMSITRKEYETAISSGMPVFTFIDSAVLSEWKTFKKNKGNESIDYVSVDNTQVFDFINDIYIRKKNNYIKSFSNLDDITDELRKQFASIVKRALNDKKTINTDMRVRINSFKLFFYRHRRGYSQNKISSKIGITVVDYRKLEKVNYKKKFSGYNKSYFPLCSPSILKKLEVLLKIEGKLSSGQNDDFTAMFMEFYAENRAKKPNVNLAKNSPLLSFKTKAVVFDYDGTITVPNNGRTTWEMIWEHLGYDINECAEYHSRFRRNNISHEDWCNITLEKFRDKNFNETSLNEIVAKIEIHFGFEELVKELRQKNIRLYVLSGSIRQIIKKSLGNVALEFEEIKANDVVFEAGTGKIESIVGTQYDFEGKSEYMKRLVSEMRYSPMDVLFVGNAGNDGWVSQSGVRTLCVNPTSTDANNPKIWWQSIREMKDMRDILPFVV